MFLSLPQLQSSAKLGVIRVARVRETMGLWCGSGNISYKNNLQIEIRKWKFFLNETILEWKFFLDGKSSYKEILLENGNYQILMCQKNILRLAILNENFRKRQHYIYLYIRKYLRTYWAPTTTGFIIPKTLDCCKLSFIVLATVGCSRMTKKERVVVLLVVTDCSAAALLLVTLHCTFNSSFTLHQRRCPCGCADTINM